MPTESQAQKPFCRIAIRQEGEFLNAYIAKVDSMEDSIFVASMLLRFAELYPNAFDEWRLFLRKLMQQFVFDLTGHQIDFEEIDARAEEIVGHG